MAQPGWTPDGAARNVAKLPGAYDVGQLVVPSHRDVGRIDVSATNDAQQWLVFPETVRLLMVEVR
jgi:hypothetical protein